MTDNVQPATIICEGGLDTTENHLFLDSVKPGAASDILNYEVGLYGGYRRIDGYTPYSNTYQSVDDTNAEGKILGLAIYRTSSDTDVIIAARKQKAGATYKFYYYDSGTGWNAYAPGFTLDTTNSNGTVLKIRSCKFNFGGDSYILFTDGVNYPTVFDGTNWYQLKSTNTGSGTGSPGGDQLIDYPKYATVFKGHVFVSGDKNFPDIVSHSAPENIFNWTAAGGGGQVTNSSTVQNIRPFRDNLYVFGLNSLRRINEDTNVFVINDVANNIGCIAPDSVIEINGDILFFAQDGVRTVSGTDKIGDVNLASISRQFQKYVNELQDSYDLSLLNSVVIKKKTQFRFFVSEASTTATGVGIIGGIRDGQNGMGWEFFKLSGIRTSCVEVGYISNDEVILHGDYDGKVYQQESGNSFNGTPITSVFASPFLSFGNPISRKRPQKVYLFTRPEGSTLVSLQTTYDWNDPHVNNPMAYTGSVEEDSVLFDSTAEYDDGTSTYALDEFNPIIKLNLEGSFKSCKFTITTTSDQPAHSIQGMVFEFTPEGASR